MLHGASEVDEPITITDYDPRWPALFASERDRVMSALGDVVTRIEHFGSTAASARVHSLEALGYENFGEIFIPGRLYLRRVA